MPTHIKVVAAQYNTTSDAVRRQVLGNAFKTIPRVTDLGFTGYGTLGDPIGFIFIQPNGTNATADEAVGLLIQAGNVTGAQAFAIAIDFPSWIEYCNAFLQDPNIATNVIDPSRLLTPEVLQEKTEELVSIVVDEFPDLHAGFNFSKLAFRRDLLD